MRRFFPALCIAMMWATGTPVRAAQPVTISFDDIFNQPIGYDWLPPFTWKGVRFTGGGLHRTDELGTWYQARNKNALQLQFPNGSTDISFDVDGVGGSIILFEKMPIQVWQGDIDDTLIATLPLPASSASMYPPKHRITIPGPASVVTIFTARPPSGVRDFGNTINLDNVRYTPPDPEPTITFDTVLPQHARVLTHNYGTDAYPSPLQTKDREIRVEATVRMNGQLAPGRTIHLRVTDPPDTAAYVVRAGTSQQNDNFDGPGSFSGGGQSTTAVSDAAGRIAVTLRATPFAAGDNYQVEASANAAFSCGSSCAKSVVYTAWKRMYLETDRMFRRGAYLAKDHVAGSDVIYVSDLSQFQSGDVVRFIHAPELQAQSGSSTSSPPVAAFFYSEDHIVDVVPTPTVLADGTILNPHLKLRAGDVLAASFGVDSSFTSPGTASVPVPYLRDAAGVVGAGFFEPDITLLAGAYEAMFVDLIAASNSVPEIPFEPYLPSYVATHLVNKWFENGQRTPSGGVIPDYNHVQIAGGTRSDLPQPTSATTGAQLGQTPPGSGHHRSWVWVRRIELAVTEPAQNVFSLAASTLNSETTLHESAHQWQVNPVAPAPTVQVGHCMLMRYQQDNKYCLMHAPFYDPLHNAELADGTADFHYEMDATGKVDSEYTHIRRSTEPFVQ